MTDPGTNPIISAVRSEADFESALHSDVETVFLIASNIITVQQFAEKAHCSGKKLFVHIDFTDGVSKDPAGAAYLAQKGIDGIISTRTNVIKFAKERGIPCIQRFFMVDSRSVDTALEALHVSCADMIEIMPAIAFKAISRMKSRTDTPIIAGGLADSKDEIYRALSAGASYVSTGAQDMWNM